MKPRHVESARANARAFFDLINARPDQDFHTLSSSQVARILISADHAKYQVPSNANGSRARYYYQRMQRHAQARQR